MMHILLIVFLTVLATITGTPEKKQPPRKAKPCQSDVYYGTNNYIENSMYRSTHFKIIIDPAKPAEAMIIGDHHLCRDSFSSTKQLCAKLAFRFHSKQKASVVYTRAGRHMKVDGVQFISGHYSVPNNKKMDSYCLDRFEGTRTAAKFIARYGDECDLKGEIVFVRPQCK